MTAAPAPPPSLAGAEGPPAVELRGITKRFPGVVANRDVDLTVRRGEVHAVVGENGAGKSTLMKILYGMQRPDEGTIAVDGQPVNLRTPADAIAAGIGMVHQHFMLADNLTVVENVVLGDEPTRAGLLDRRRARRRISELSDAYGLGVDPDRLVEELGVGDRQRVEILKVLYRGARVLILDEPTAVLVPQEVDELFAALQGLRAEGLTVVFISHKLDEVLKVADTVTVVRAGTTVTTVPAAELSARQLAELMVGGELPTPARGASTVTDRVVLDVQHVTLPAAGGGRDLLSDVSLTLRAGEVVGLAGVEGNGQVELVEVLLGLRTPSAGRVLLAPRAEGGAPADTAGTGRPLVDITGWGTRRRREAGIGYIPEDRQRQGLLLEAALWENRVLGHQGEAPLARGPWVDRRASRADTRRIMGDYDVRAPGPDTPAFALSGGNQQKLVVGREMSGTPVVLVASHPTRGVDVGAQAVIWGHVRDARAAGLAVLLVSADLEELLGLSDTLHVVLRGRLVATVDPTTVTPQQLGAAMTGAGG